MGYKEDYRAFLDGFLTPELKEKYQIKSIEKTNVCWRGKGIFAPFFQVYVRAILDNNQKEEIKELLTVAYKQYYKTDVLPGINVLGSAVYVQEYKGKHYHLCVANDSKDRNFVDYEIFELLPSGYEAVLNKNYAMYHTEHDKAMVIRINFNDGSTEDAYKEIHRNGLSEKLLEMVL